MAQWSGFETGGQKPVWGWVCGFETTILLIATPLAGIPTVPVPVMQLHACVEGPDQAPGRESHHFPHPYLRLHPEAPEAGFLSLASVVMVCIERQAWSSGLMKRN